MTRKRKALCVFSGGLDSILAAEIIRAQGIDIVAICFETPFFSSKSARKSAHSSDIPLKVVDITERHLRMVMQPAHGYGENMNPCIDCHALMFKIAGEMLEGESAHFVVTGEVLGQRPMSQNKKAMATIAVESGLNGLLLRPLSAKLLPPSIPEETGWVDRGLLMEFKGRSRKPQMALAQSLGIRDYPSPAGGCLLTEKAFSRRLRDLLGSVDSPSISEIELLKVGRHFRVSPRAKMVVGRNKAENEKILALAGQGHLILNSLGVPGPTVLFSGEPSQSSLQTAVALTLAYSDLKEGQKGSVQVEAKGDAQVVSSHAVDKLKFRQYML